MARPIQGVLGVIDHNNDLVYLVGRLDGTYTYDTNGGTNTVPLIDVTQLRLAGTTTTTVKPTVTTHGHVVRAFQNITGGTLAGGYILYSNGQVNAVDGPPSMAMLDIAVLPTSLPSLRIQAAVTGL